MAHLLRALILVVLAPSAGLAQGVFVSIPPQAFLVERLAGQSVDLEILLPPGASPATYEPTPLQMAALDRSRLYLQIGAPFEGPVLKKIANLMPGLRIVDCRAGVELEPMDTSGHDHATGGLDPHIWLDPRRMMIVAGTTAKALQELLPAKAATIEENLHILRREIEQTDRRVAEILAPHNGKTVLVFHPAFGYFTRRYGLVQTAIEHDGKVPSARQLAAVIDQLEDREVRALFVQPQFSRSTAQRVAAALDCELVELNPLAGDYLANLQSMARAVAAEMR
jgi:zinc transport system substrate-binding protein